MDQRNSRLMRNTIAMYIRMVFTTLIGLYTSRLTLQVLGIEDFGIYNVVGGVVSFFSFISNSMSISIQRYYAVELGKNDIDKLNKVFSMAINIHLVIAIIVFLLAESIGLYFVEEKLNIPSYRDTAVLWIYQFIVLSIVLNIIQVPYSGLIISYERIKIFAYVSIVEVVLKLGLIIILLYIDTDKLIFYGLFMLITTLFVVGFNILYCKFSFKEIKYCFSYNRAEYYEMLNFAAWTAIGEIAWTFVTQGVNIILNIFFGPIINAARGISTQIQSFIQRFVQSFQTPLNPQIMKSYAQHETKRVINLFFKGTVYSYYLVLIISIPIILNIEYLLKIWLKNFPEEAIPFCIVTIIGILVDILGNLVQPIIKANGNIKKFNIVTSLTLFINFPISYLVLKLGFEAYSVLFVYCFISFVTLIIKLIFLQKVISFTIIDFLKRVIYPICRITILYSIISYCIHNLINPNSIIYLLADITTMCITGILLIYAIGIDNKLRIVINKYIKTRILKIN